jgi:hypothetical protein
MENIFYDRQIARIYDLKGSERSRCVCRAARGEVLAAHCVCSGDPVHGCDRKTGGS